MDLKWTGYIRWLLLLGSGKNARWKPEPCRSAPSSQSPRATRTPFAQSLSVKVNHPVPSISQQELVAILNTKSEDSPAVEQHCLHFAHGYTRFVFPLWLDYLREGVASSRALSSPLSLVLEFSREVLHGLTEPRAFTVPSRHLPPVLPAHTHARALPALCFFVSPAQRRNKTLPAGDAQSSPPACLP